MPSLTTIKGLEVAALYPVGLVRYMNDLDVIAPSEPDLWRAVGLLAGDGWDIDTATFTQFGGAMRVMVSMRMPNEDRFRLPYGIELANYYTLGNRGGIAPLVQIPQQWTIPAIKNTIMLLHERYEQPYRARDLVDAALLHRSMDEAERVTLTEAVVALGLAIEYSELIKLVDKAGLGQLPALPGGRLTTARSRAARLGLSASFFTSPVMGAGRHLQRRLIMAKPGRAEGAVWERVQRRLHPVSALKAGLVAFGLPVGGPRADVSATVLHRRGEFAWADTPAGRFLLTVGDYVSQSAVDELTEDKPVTEAGAVKEADAVSPKPTSELSQ